jgi:hypothetical protein
MTVKELRDILARKPDDLRVLVRGYEDGFEDLAPSEVKEIDVALNFHGDGSSVYGPHEHAERADNASKPFTVSRALVLDRGESEYRNDPEPR